MGRRQRRRASEGGDAAPERGRGSSTDYTDPEGNVLTLRDRLSWGAVRELRGLAGRPGASADDLWQRREELLFERLAVRWEIAGLPLESQKELLGRYRMATTHERRWIRDTIEGHLDEHGGRP
jgi:hypothetical protein